MTRPIEHCLFLAKYLHYYKENQEIPFIHKKSTFGYLYILYSDFLTFYVDPLITWQVNGPNVTQEVFIKVIQRISIL